MYLQNKYTRWYYSIIDQARARSIPGYTERHHIIPRSLGGTDHRDNLVDLTAREHFICHALLCFMLSDPAQKRKILNAFMSMNRISSTHQNQRYVNSRIYQILKVQWAKTQSEKMRIDNPSKKGLSDEHKIKISQSLKGRSISETHRENLSKSLKGRSFYRSPEEKAEAAKKASAKLTGRKHTQATKDLLREIRKDWKNSEEAKQKMREAWTPERKAKQAERSRLQNASRPILTCPHCGKQGKNPGNMFRYHFDNCSICLH